MKETGVRSLGQEDPLEEEMATHSSILAWRIPGTEEPGSYGPWDHKKLDWATNTFTQSQVVPMRNVIESRSG